MSDAIPSVEDAEANYLSMSDEEISEMGFPPEVATEPEDDTDTDTADNDPESEPEGDDGEDDAAPAQSDDADDDEPAEEEPAPEKDPDVETDGEDVTADEAPIDYKAAYEKLLAPFKANGKDLQVKNVDEALTLMQMGANYNKKMSALKPNLKLLKMLENNQLLDETKLNFLVDLDKKNPLAIQKLMKDSGLDPLDFEDGKESEYRPNTHNVHDREIELDTVLEEIQDTPSYSRTINVVSTEWDGASKQEFAKSPQLLKVINDHMASGIFDQISNEMNHERTLGRLNGLSDLDAYKQIGDAIQQRGGFDQRAQPSQQAPAPTLKKTASPKSKATDPKLKSKKRAASSTQSTGSNKGEADYNPLAMSDDDFSKLVNEKLM